MKKLVLSLVIGLIVALSGCGKESDIGKNEIKKDITGLRLGFSNQWYAKYPCEPVPGATVTRRFEWTKGNGKYEGRVAATTATGYTHYNTYKGEDIDSWLVLYLAICGKPMSSTWAEQYPVPRDAAL